MEPQALPESKKTRWSTVVVTLVAFVLIILIVVFNLPNLLQLGQFISPSGSTSTYYVNPINTSITNSSIGIAYPPNYSILESYALSIINENRSTFNLSPVTVSPIPSGQEHADSMLKYGYFSHWDTNGFKPYMRYSILNGTGFVEENVAYIYTNIPAFTSTKSIENAIGNLEWQMMNNDSLCCNNGHRNNILNPFHNRVSIGIAYDLTHVYFVEDLETYFMNLNTPITNSTTVHLQGTTSQALNPSSIQIFYDKSPTSLSADQLNNEYNGPYNGGTFVGGVLPSCDKILPSCYRFSQGITVSASTWSITSSSINIAFSLDNFIKSAGNGVYTIYLTQGSQSDPEYLTSISIFVSN